MNATTSKNKFSIGVPKVPTAAAAKRGFVDAARGKDTLPWQDIMVTDDLVRTINVRIPARIVIMLDWLCAKHSIPKRAGVQDAVEKWCLAELKKLGIEP